MFPILSKQFLIYGQSRSGSTLLVNLMNASPLIHCDKELFGGSYVSNPVVRRIYNRFPIPFIYQMRRGSKHEVYGFKLLFYQVRYTRYWLRFLHQLGWKVIHLRRRNIVHQAFSSIIAHRSQQWHRRAEDEPRTNQILIKPDQLERELSRRERWTAQELDFIGDLPRLILIYEDDLLDANVWPATINKISAYLSTPPFRVGSLAERKTDDRPPSMIISNYAELQVHFAKSNYARFFDA
jgi:LPS sulfotransferase NodH